MRGWISLETLGCLYSDFFKMFHPLPQRVEASNCCYQSRVASTLSKLRTHISFVLKLDSICNLFSIKKGTSPLFLKFFSSSLFWSKTRSLPQPKVSVQPIITSPTFTFLIQHGLTSCVIFSPFKPHLQPQIWCVPNWTRCMPCMWAGAFWGASWVA
jgi:hypothetical protein